MRRWLTVAVVGLVTVAAATSCSSDDSANPSETQTGASSPDSTAPDTSGPESTESDPGESAPSVTEPGATEPETSASDSPPASSGDLGGSWTGVTADSIKLGLAGIDPDAVRSFGIEYEGPGSEQLFETWIAALNDRGGIHGRMLELAFTPYLPIGAAQAEAACVALTEDEQVFAATGILLGDTSLCITETHETPYIGLFGQSAERNARAIAPFLAIEMADDRQRLAGVQQFIADGLLTDTSVALYTEAQDVAVTDGTIKPELDAAGVDVVVSSSLDDFGDDTAAQDQALDSIVAKMQAEDVDVVLNVSNFAPLMVAFQRNGWFPELVLSTSAQALSADFVAGTGVLPASMENVLVAAPYVPTKDELLADEALASCIDEYNASGSEPQIDASAASAASLVAVAGQCASFRLFVLAAEGAGPDLTPESFGQAADALGELHLPGVPYGSLRPDKRSVGDAIGVYDFDAEAKQMVATGPAIQVQ